MANLIGKTIIFTQDVNNAEVKVVKLKRIPNGTVGRIISSTYGYVVGEFEKDGVIYNNTVSLNSSTYQGKWQVDETENPSENQPNVSNNESEISFSEENLLLHGGKKKHRRSKTTKKIF